MVLYEQNLIVCESIRLVLLFANLHILFQHIANLICCNYTGNPTIMTTTICEKISRTHHIPQSQVLLARSSLWQTPL